MNKKSPFTILNFLLKQQNELHTREIARKTGLSLGFVSRFLNALSRQELILLTKKGRMKFYRANILHPLIKQLKILITISSLMPLINNLKPLSRRIILFGICAHGENLPESDIDLFILTNYSQEVRIKLSQNPKIVPVIMNSKEFAEFRKKDASLYEQIIRGLALWETNESADSIIEDAQEFYSFTEEYLKSKKE